MPTTTVVTVCLPKDTPTSKLATAAAAALAATLRTPAGPVGHFTIGTRWHRNELLQPWQDTAAGGPILRLHLAAMHIAARNTYWYRWLIWHRVVDGTRPAQPYWMFLDRHKADPAKYPLSKAQQQYRAQARIAAMLTYNALPNKIIVLPTSHLEAFQAGAHAYAHLGLLSAVPGDGMITLDGRYLAATSDRLTDRLSYLDAAQQHLGTLSPRDRLVALATR